MGTTIVLFNGVKANMKSNLDLNSLGMSNGFGQSLWLTNFSFLFCLHNIMWNQTFEKLKCTFRKALPLCAQYRIWTLPLPSGPCSSSGRSVTINTEDWASNKHTTHRSPVTKFSSKGLLFTFYVHLLDDCCTLWKQLWS